MNAAMRRVALFSTQFLPYSQTFIYEQLQEERRFESTVFCHRFAGDHATASLILKVNLLLVLIGIGASAVASVPDAVPPKLQTPLLATHQ